MQVPLCDACDTVMTPCCSGRGLMESSFCCLWSSQWLNLLYNYAHYIQYMQVPLCDACDTVMTQCCSCRGSSLTFMWTRGEHLLLFVKLSVISMRPSGCSVSSSEGVSPTGDAWSSAPAQGCRDAVDHSVSSSWAPQRGKWPGSPAHSSCGWRRLFLLTQRLQKHKLMKLTKLEELVAHVISFKASGTVCWFQKSTKSAVTDRMWRLI